MDGASLVSPNEFAPAVAAQIDLTAECEATMAVYGSAPGKYAVSVVLAFVDLGAIKDYRPWRIERDDVGSLYLFHWGKNDTASNAIVERLAAVEPPRIFGLTDLKDSCDAQLESLPADRLAEFSYGLTSQPAAVLHNLNLAYAAMVDRALFDVPAGAERMGVLLPALLRQDGAAALVPRVSRGRPPRAQDRFVPVEYVDDQDNVVLRAEAYAALLYKEEEQGNGEKKFVNIDKLWIRKIGSTPVHAEDALPALPAKFAENLDALTLLEAWVRDQVTKRPAIADQDFLDWLRVACVSAMYERVNPGVRSLPSDRASWNRRSPFVGLSDVADGIGYPGNAALALAKAEADFLSKLGEAIRDPSKRNEIATYKFLAPEIKRFWSDCRIVKDAMGIVTLALARVDRLAGQSGAPQEDLKNEIAAILRDSGIDPAISGFGTLPEAAIRSLSGILRHDLLGTPLSSRSGQTSVSIWARVTDIVDKNEWAVLIERMNTGIFDYWVDVVFAGRPLGLDFAELKKQISTRVEHILPSAPATGNVQDLGAYPLATTAKDEGLSFVVSELLPKGQTAPDHVKEDENPHVRLKGLAYYARRAWPDATAWGCVSRAGFGLRVGEAATKLLDSFVDALAVTPRGGLNGAIVRVMGRNFDLRPKSEFATIDLPKGEAEAEPGGKFRFERVAPANWQSVRLAYGAAYELRAACLTNAGLGPGEIAQANTVFPKLDSVALAEDETTTLKRWFLRTTKVQKPTIRFGERPVDADAVLPKAIDPATLLSVRPDLSEIERPLAREFRAADEAGGEGVDVAVVVPEQLSRLCLLIAPPAIDFDTWRHYVRGEMLLGSTNDLEKPTEVQVSAIEEKYIQLMNSRSAASGRVPFLPDPAVWALEVTVTVRSAPNWEGLQSDTRLFASKNLWSYAELSADSIDMTPVVRCIFEEGSFAVRPIPGAQSIKIAAPKGSILTISVRAIVSDEVFARDTDKQNDAATKKRRFVPSTAFTDAKNLAKNVDLMTPAAEFDVEIATDAMPTQKEIFAALKIGGADSLTASLGEGREFLYLDRFRVHRQRWDWRGRDVQFSEVAPLPKSFGPGDPWWAVSHGDADADAGDATWFGDRANDDALAEWFDAWVYDTQAVPKLGAKIDRPPFPFVRTNRYEYYRFRVEAFSRYHGLRIDGKIVGSKMGADPNSPYGWKRLYLSATGPTGETRLPTPAIHAIVPVGVGPSDFGEEDDSLAASLAVWVDGDWYAPAGLARKLVCRVEVMERKFANPADNILQHGSDPLRSTSAADTRPDAKDPRIALVGGPIGLTFDLDAEAPKIANSAFRLSPKGTKIEPGDFLKIRFRSEYEPGATGLSAEQLEAAASEWSASHWVQIPAHRNRFKIKGSETPKTINVDKDIAIALLKSGAGRKIAITENSTGRNAEFYRRAEFREGGTTDFVAPNITGKYFGPGLAIAFVDLRGSGESASLGQIKKIVSMKGDGTFDNLVIDEGRYVAYVLRYGKISGGNELPGELTLGDLFTAYSADDGEASDAQVLLESVSSPITVAFKN
jgi:hypothetical protein